MVIGREASFAVEAGRWYGVAGRKSGSTHAQWQATTDALAAASHQRRVHTAQAAIRYAGR